ncbi:MAG: M15 family metallopeptidase [Clostridia bacterium]|nr:M15 family metallopeptidase [Clostridia bacterium]
MCLPDGFYDLGKEIPELIVDIRYATPHNLTGHPLNGYEAGKAIGTRALLEGMKRAVKRANGLRFRVFDAYRPQRAVMDFVKWAQAPENGLTKAEFYPALPKEQLFPLGYIALKSGHSRGSTIDLTLEGLDMGTAFDLMDDRSHHGALNITPQQAFNRQQLKAIMVSAGFAPYANEWWHYRLLEEPYPDTYFDFVIK